MAKNKVEHKKVSLIATNQSVEVPLSSVDITKLRMIARDTGKSIDALLREAIGKFLESHRQIKAEIMKF